MTDPVLAAVASPHELVRRGVVGMLDRHPDRVTVVELAPAGPTVAPPDVVVYDAVEIHDREGDDRLRALARSFPSRVVALAPHFRPDLSNRALEAGAVAVVTFTVTSEQLVEIVESVGRGRGRTDGRATRLSGAVDTPDPGLGAGLTAREAQVLALVARGKSNQEVADELYLSINSVKTYIRSSYRKIGAKSRSQAVLWALVQGVDQAGRTT